jgi:riboflavin kinase/FMN adenylyltransferase
MLTSTPHKLALLAQSGLDGVVVHPFTRELASLEPEAFIDFLRDCVPSHAALVVGFNFNFGHRARGDTTMLRELGTARGFDVHIVGGLQWNGDGISSTRIRQAVTTGRLDEAAAMLGRPFSVFGKVIHGKQLGRQLGFPTANVQPENEVRPPPGSYAARARVGDTWYDGAAYVHNPARGAAPIVEFNAFDCSPDFYGADMEACFLRQIRGDQRFETLDALKAQIARDVSAIRRYFATK